MASAHQSDSAEQRTAETYALEAAGEKIGVGLRPRTLTLPDGAGVEIDGVADGAPAILAEVYAHQGRLKGGQFHKLRPTRSSWWPPGGCRPPTGTPDSFSC